jgi:hypothetical protein
MIAFLVPLAIIVPVLQVRSPRECVQQDLTVLVEVQHRPSMMPLLDTMLSKDLLCK